MFGEMIVIRGEEAAALFELANKEFKMAKAYQRQTAHTVDSCLVGCIGEYAAAKFLEGKSGDKLITTSALAKRYIDFVSKDEAKGNKAARLNMSSLHNDKHWEEGDIEVYDMSNESSAYWEVKAYKPSYGGVRCAAQVTKGHVDKYKSHKRRGVLFVEVTVVSPSTFFAKVVDMKRLEDIEKWEMRLSLYNTRLVRQWMESHPDAESFSKKHYFYSCVSKGDKGYCVSYTHPDNAESHEKASEWMYS